MGVSNMDTRNAEKNPKNAVVKTLLLIVNEAAIDRRQYPRVIPLHGSVVSARDNNIGINGSPHVGSLTSTIARTLNIINETNPNAHVFRKVACFRKFVY